jgi:two-component system phosphate regulon sensor histidine kinase PhoR
VRSLRARLAIAGAVASAVAIVFILLILSPRVLDDARAEVEERLLAEAHLLAESVRDGLGRNPPGSRAAAEEMGAIDALVDRAARSTATRLTVMDAGGRVMGDSAASGADLLALDNHLTRPEVIAARDSGEGRAVRRGSTLSENLLSVAVPVRGPRGIVGYARASLSLGRVETRLDALHGALGSALAVAWIVAALLALLLSRALLGPLREIMEGARRFASGDLANKIRVDRDDELGELAAALNKGAATLEEQLQESERATARFGAVLEAMEDGVLALDANGLILFANEALRSMRGLVEPPRGHYIEVFRQPELASFVEAVLREQAHQTREIELIPGGKPYLVTGLPFPRQGGGLPGAVLTFHNISERREVDRIRRDFVANASHELRTPLTSIRGFVEALEDGGLDDRATAVRFLGRVKANADRMAALVDDLLEISRLDSGASPPAMEMTNLAPLVEDIGASFREVATRKGLTFAVDIGESASAFTDPDRVRRALEHLVDNAIKYTEAGGEVKLGLRGPSARDRPSESADERAWVVVSVRDTGPGIALEHQQRLFERFYRADKARSREVGGTGLGLSIVKRLVEGMGARVSVESELGRGSTFLIHLPLSPPS